MLTTKRTRLGTTSVNHTTRAMISQEPVKRVFAGSEATAPPALFCSVYGWFMYLFLSRNGRSCLSGSEAAVEWKKGPDCPASLFFSYITIYVFQNRYGKRNERVCLPFRVVALLERGSNLQTHNDDGDRC